MDELLASLEASATVALFGGSVRDVFVWGSNIEPRDLDFVVSGIQPMSLRRIIEQSEVPFTVNRFGGIKAQLASFTVDLWTLESTWAFRHGYLVAGVERLPDSVFLNIDSIGWDLNHDALIGTDRFFQAFGNNVLDIVLEPNPFPDLNVLRSLVYSQRLGLHLSDRLQRYLYRWSVSAEHPIGRLDRVAQSHYGTTSLKGLSVDIGPLMK